MFLGQISWLDCAAFILFLVPQLLIEVGPVLTITYALKALPFLAQLPFRLISERYLVPYEQKSPFGQHCTLFQDTVIQCVRYTFANIPASIGRAFLSKPVSLPFLRFRMLRNGLWRSPIYWREVNRGDLRGVYMVHDQNRQPDIVVLYCHGGGFSMGSTYFYLEFLLSWVSALRASGYTNPALFSLEYTLVPEATYPTQVQQALAGYKYVVSLVDDSARICVSGDSAGGTLVLSLLLCLSDFTPLRKNLPGLAVLISPWTTLKSSENRNTASDYLDADRLDLYSSLYIGARASPTDSLVSPGQCRDLSWWRRASPSRGCFFVYGAEEVFAPDIKQLAQRLRTAGAEVVEREEKGWIHAWPVIKLFLCNQESERHSGIEAIVDFIRGRIPPRKPYV